MKAVPGNISDEELLARYRESHKSEQLAELYKRYIPLVYGVALKYFKYSEDAQDAVMDIFEELLTKVQVNDIRLFRPWLYVCVRNYCLMKLRKRSLNPILTLDENFMEFCDDFHLTVVNERENREKSLRECIEGLPERQRVSVKYFFLNELSYKEVEERTGFSSKMVKSFIQNGKRNLKLCLERKVITSNETD